MQKTLKLIEVTKGPASCNYFSLPGWLIVVYFYQEHWSVLLQKVVGFGHACCVTLKVKFDQSTEQVHQTSSNNIHST